MAISRIAEEVALKDALVKAKTRAVNVYYIDEAPLKLRYDRALAVARFVYNEGMKQLAIKYAVKDGER